MVSQRLPEWYIHDKEDDTLKDLVERALRGFAACSGGRAPKALAMLAAIWQIEIELYVSIKNFLSKTFFCIDEHTNC